MQNLYVKPPKEYSKRKKVILYIISALIIGFLISGSFWKEQEYKRSVLEGKKLTVKIRRVHCTSGKGQSGLYFLDRNNKINVVNINYQDCHKYSEGDIITVLPNEKQDWYYIENNQKDSR